ncbi:hypothetical protein AB0O64_17965 [Streptomyces sp. NPDC088341]|uniref:hypothetical protein n=1 Tax=Streptomyces sp. NPDC088341 TaxID=3154870 RepID=UPI003443CFE7
MWPRPPSPPAGTSKKLLPLLEKRVPGYDKTRVDFFRYRDGVPQAGERARKLDPSGAEHTLSPSTGVWRLTDRMANP